MTERLELNKYKSKKLGCTGCYIDLSFDQEWSRIEIIKNLFEQFTVSRTSKEHDIHRIGIAVSELLANAVTYSVRKKIRVVIQQVESSNVFIICITNKADKINIKRLRERLKEIRSMDSLAYYIYRMKESVKDKHSPPGLGLARVYHESQAYLSARIADNERIVEIKAIINLN